MARLLSILLQLFVDATLQIFFTISTLDKTRLLTFCSTMVEEMNEEEMNEQAPDVTMPSFTIYIPDFLPEYGLSEKSVEDQKNKLIRKDWLTFGLIQEIESWLTTRSDINVDEDNKRDPAAFQQKIAQLFPPGRIFSSFKQLDQAADMFLGAWAVKKIISSKSIQCAYSASHAKQDRKHADPSKRSKIAPTLKSVYKCPFILRYSFVEYYRNKTLKKPDIFYQVKITQVNYVE
jgi:hypothetical protein